MYNYIHIPLNADLQGGKKGAISELSVQRLYLRSPNVGVSEDLTLGRQFSQRPNVINGCHLRGAGWGWAREKKKSSKEDCCRRKGTLAALRQAGERGWSLAGRRAVLKWDVQCHFQSLQCGHGMPPWKCGAKSFQPAIRALCVGNVRDVH